MEMTATSYRGARAGRDDLVFKTVDGNDIALDAIIAYRIDPAKAPDILINTAQSNRELEEKLVRPITRNVTREFFGELKTEDFYVANKRADKAEAAKNVLNKTLILTGSSWRAFCPRITGLRMPIRGLLRRKRLPIRWWNVLSQRSRFHRGGVSPEAATDRRRSE